MKAFRLTPGAGIDGIVPVTLPDPQPGPGEVLIRVRSTSLNYRDLLNTRRTRHAVIPLSDGAGDVVALGEGVRRFSVGDRAVACFFPYWFDGRATPEAVRDPLGGEVDGMLAELVALPAESVIHVPSYMSYDEAATLPCAALTAWNAMFEETRLLPGQSVLLLGTGGVSIAGLQLAHLAGLRAIITSSSDAKLARARELGADATINYRERVDWEQAVLEATDGHGVELVLEVGGEGTFAQSLAATCFGGHIALIGLLAPGGEAAPPAPLVVRNIRETRIHVGSRTMFEYGEAVAAYRYLEQQAHFGKVVIRV